MKKLALCIGMVLASARIARASVQTYLDDYVGFQAAAGVLHTIDFETLPDGTPSHPGVLITSTFNYDAQGAHFSAPLGQIQITGNNLSHNPFQDFAIDVIVNQGQRTWITADLAAPSSAIGVFFSGHDQIFAYSASGVLLAAPSIFVGGDHFIGITSDVPIARVIGDPGDVASDMGSFLFAPIPEPATIGLLAIGAILVFRRHF